MTGTAHQKVNAGHLKRNAYLYVRQSTLRQVFENTESTKRQYGPGTFCLSNCNRRGGPSKGRTSRLNKI